MEPELARPFDWQEPLVRCPGCASTLIYTIDALDDPDAPGHQVDRMLRLVGIALVDRRCPDCEYRDAVATSALAVAIAYRQETCRLAGLRALAESLAEQVERDGAEAEPRVAVPG
jgi:hypothetical protein